MERRAGSLRAYRTLVKLMLSFDGWVGDLICAVFHILCYCSIVPWFSNIRTMAPLLDTDVEVFASDEAIGPVPERFSTKINKGS